MFQPLLEQLDPLRTFAFGVGCAVLGGLGVWAATKRKVCHEDPEPLMKNGFSFAETPAGIALLKKLDENKAKIARIEGEDRLKRLREIGIPMDQAAGERLLGKIALVQCSEVAAKAADWPPGRWPDDIPADMLAQRGTLDNPCCIADLDGVAWVNKGAEWTKYDRTDTLKPDADALNRDAATSKTCLTPPHWLYAALAKLSPGGGTPDNPFNFTDPDGQKWVNTGAEWAKAPVPPQDGILNLAGCEGAIGMDFQLPTFTMPHIVVPDAQFFLDHSSDIAAAVRKAIAEGDLNLTSEVYRDVQMKSHKVTP